MAEAIRQKQPLQCQKPNLIIHKDATEKKPLTKDEQDARDALLLEYASHGNTDMANDMIKWLLDNGANIEARNKESKTALMVAAAYNGHTETCALLLDRGADINAKTQLNSLYGWTAYDFARASRNRYTVAFLRSYPLMGTERSMAFIQDFKYCVIRASHSRL
jgi:ankyrin repeat protein